MAVTNFKKQEETAKNTQQVTSAQPYSGMSGVSQNTAANLANYQAGYKQSDAVTKAQQNLQQVQAQKPQSYTSKYQGALDNIMAQIQNPEQFRYEFNGDNLFKAYSDMYQQKGKQAAMDVQGQAAALTGGYGNSYGQQVGQQQYDQYLLDLYDKGMDLRDRAYQAYQDKLANNYNIYNTLAAADQSDYGRYRDAYGDWQTEEQLAYNRAADERNFDYGQYSDALNYYTQLAQLENSSNLNDRQLAEQIRQADLDEQYRRDTFAYEQAAADKEYAYNYVKAILSNGQMPSAELLAAAGLSQEDAQRMMIIAQATGGSGGGTGGSGSGGDTYYGDVDAYGNVRYFKRDSNGNLTEVNEKEAKKHDINTALLDNRINMENATNTKNTILNNAIQSAISTAKPANTQAATLTDAQKKLKQASAAAGTIWGTFFNTKK